MGEHIVFVPGVGGREWFFEHQIRNLADIATGEVLVLDSQPDVPGVSSAASLLDLGLRRATDGYNALKADGVLV